MSGLPKSEVNPGTYEGGSLTEPQPSPESHAALKVNTKVAGDRVCLR